jgi:hypothetical protein
MPIWHKMVKIRKGTVTIMRLIDADVLKEVVVEIKVTIDEDILECENVAQQLVYLLEKVEKGVLEKIDEQPTVELQGEWIRKGDGFYYCSSCDSPAYWDSDMGQVLSKHCLFCGAKMEKNNE